MTKRILTTLAMAALVGPALADIPDGHGGRTSPQAANHAPATAARRHDCCARTKVSTPRLVVSSPAELKALGHLAWVSRGDEPVSSPACYKSTPVREVKYNSPAELKTLGHLASSAAPAAHTETKLCCGSASCPMHRPS
jgi:hypothetical protein